MHGNSLATSVLWAKVESDSDAEVRPLWLYTPGIAFL